VTESDQIRPPEVTDKQSIAIDALVGGATHREAAEAAGVQRTTVTSWCNHHIAFIAELNLRRRQRLQAVGDKLHEAVGAAVGVLADRVTDGDTDCALAVMRLVGVEHLLAAAKPGPSTYLGVHAELSSNLKSECLMDLFGSPDCDHVVENRSEESGRLEPD
jgi:hypothetical protein